MDLVFPADHVRDLVVLADHVRDLVVQVVMVALVVLVVLAEAEMEVLDHMVAFVLALTTDRLLAGEADEVRHQFRQSRNPGF